jgi:hypothetical protein
MGKIAKGGIPDESAQGWLYRFGEYEDRIQNKRVKVKKM